MRKHHRKLSIILAVCFFVMALLTGCEGVSGTWQRVVKELEVVSEADVSAGEQAGEQVREQAGEQAGDPAKLQEQSATEWYAYEQLSEEEQKMGKHLG